MKKYVVETYYTWTFKTVHNLSNLDESELAKIDKRTDGEVEVIDVKLNNRKTKKIGNKDDDKTHKPKLEKIIPNNIKDKVKISENNQKEN